jgi:hypothetical protein
MITVRLSERAGETTVEVRFWTARSARRLLGAVDLGTTRAASYERTDIVFAGTSLRTWKQERILASPARSRPHLVILGGRMVLPNKKESKREGAIRTRVSRGPAGARDRRSQDRRDARTKAVTRRDLWRS